jgi:hypothetical protein
MADIGIHGADPHEEIARLEAQIDELGEKLESCRKFILAGRVAVAAGSIVLIALLLGAIRFDPAVMACAAVGLLGGFVAWGSNLSTANETTGQIAAAEAARAALIGQIQLRVIEGRATLH